MTSKSIYTEFSEQARVFPLTPMQQGMLYASTAGEAIPGAYIEQVEVAPAGQFDEQALREVWRVLYLRHDVLRARFEWRGLDAALQVIEEHALPEIRVVRLEETAPAEEAARTRAWLEEDRARGIKLDTPPPHRVSVLLFSGGRWRMIWTVHHALADGRAMSVVLREFYAVYTALLRGDALPALPAAARFADFVREATAARPDDEAYWRGALQGLDEPVYLPLPTPRAPGAAIGEVRTSLAADSLRSLEELARRLEVTVATLVHGAWAILLSRYTGQERVIFGVTRAMAPGAGAAEAAVGLYINTQPMICTVQPGMEVQALLRELRAAWLAQRAHAHAPLQQIRRWSGVPGGEPLFDTYTVYERGRIDALIKRDGAVPESWSFTLHERTPSPLTLAVYEDTTLDIHLEFDACRFEHAAIGRIAGHLVHLLQEFPVSADRPVGSLRMLGEEELAALVPAPAPAPPFTAVHHAIAAMALRHPRSVALQHRGRRLTYAELDVAVNAHAHALRAQGVEPGDIVGLCVPRSCEAVLAILGILRCGAAYLPIDPGLPLERRQFMCADSGARLLLGTEDTLASMERAGLNLLDISGVKGGAGTAHLPPLNTPVPPEALAYVIYTSGSTGKPKGVAVTHGALAAFVDGASSLYGITSADCVLQFASLSFDASIEEIFPALTAGARLVVRTDEMIDSATGFIEQCRALDLTVIDLPTAYWHLLIESLDRVQWPERLRLVIIGGEAARRDKLDRWRRFVPATVRVANTYGPTETTVAVTCAFLEKESGTGPVPIGVAFPNAAAYVLSPEQAPVPQGVPGELCIAGPQLALGYLGRDDLTERAFVRAPWDDEIRLYRTGDRVYQREDGALVYLGRIDRQVKLRGYRIELGEIESVVQAHPAVAEAVVILREDQPGNEMLCAYVTLNTPQPLQEFQQALRAHAGELLPSYMQPAHVMVLDALPMTSSQKLDRNALPAPQPGPALRAIFPPQTPAEAQLLEIWREVFGHEEIGCHDDFLAIGGHSLLAIQIASRIRAAHDVNLGVADLLEASTIARLAAHLETAPKEAIQPIAPLPEDAPARLTPDQEIVWVFERMYPGTPTYHIPIVFRLDGPINSEVLALALDAVVARHEPLRSVFRVQDDAPIMVAADRLQVPWTHEEAREANDEAVRAWVTRAAVAPMDIEQGPLLRAALLRIGDAFHIVCVTVHHLVSDGWSVGVLTSEWGASYRALLEKREPELPLLPLRYRDYAAWYLEQTPRPGSAADIFWHAQLTPPPPRLAWPRREAAANEDARQGSQYPVHLSKELSDGLVRLAHEHGVTPFTLLFTLYALALERLTDQQDFVVGLSLAGRTRAEFERLVGFFIATLVLRIRTEPGMRFERFLRQTGGDLIAAQQHQHMPFDRLRRIDGGQDPERPLLQALFLMQSMPLPPLDVPGVRAQTLQVDMGKAITDLTLELYPSDTGFNGWLEYQTKHFDRATIARLGALFDALAAHAVADPRSPLGTFPRWVEIAAPAEIAAAPPLAAPPPPAALRVQRDVPQQGGDNPTDAVEAGLLEEFASVLHMSSVGVRDNFFDLGGHSLLAILLLERLERRFGVRLPPVRIYQVPTVRGLAQFVRDPGAEPESRVLHRIQPRGTRLPLFFVGSTDMVPPLLPWLDPEQPVYGLNIFGLLPDEGPVPELSVESIARAYIAEMQKVQPQGPYRLAAYCRDTMLALEVAQQLWAAGHTVDRLIGIDFFWWSSPKHSRLVRHVINLRDFGVQYAREKLREAARTLRERRARRRAEHAQERHDAAPVHRNTAFISAYYDAVARYDAMQYPGQVDIILCTEWGIEELPEWAEIAQGGVIVHLLKACHHNLWNPPQDRDLAAIISACVAAEKA